MTPSNAGSRNGLITWAVIASVVGFGSLIWAVVSYTQASKAQDELQTLQQQYGDVVDRPGLTGNEVAALKDIRGDADRGFSSSTKLLDVAQQRTGQLVSYIGGPGATDDKRARADVTAALAEAQAAVGQGATIPNDSVIGAVRAMSTSLGAMKAENARLAESVKSAEAARKAALDEKAALVAANNKALADFQVKATASQTDATAYRASADQQLAGVQANLVAKSTELIQNNEQLNNRINALQQQLAAARREGDELKEQLGSFRVPTDQILKQADGVVTRTPGNDRCFISLGKGDQISPGMTFEVYDKLGVPTVAPNVPEDDRLLKGKASIEVISVQPGISECRVVRLSPGATITEGDPIVNVVYDKNVKFNFYVFGKYNLDYRGEATDRDGEIVKRLISGWGANVTDRLDTKTDFVVIGEEPVVPTYSQDELAREPEKAFQKEQAEQALEQFNTIRGQAQALNIPILNQTRFLYMIGYYEEAAR